MFGLRKILVLALVASAAAAAPATALAKPRAQPLADVAPLGAQFKDRVTSSNRRVAHAAADGAWASYPTKDGAMNRRTMLLKSSAIALFAAALSPARAQSDVIEHPGPR